MKAPRKISPTRTRKPRSPAEPQISRPSRIPTFKTREQAAEWFDRHDMADYQDEFKTVRARFARNLSEGITIRLDPETLAKLREAAQQKGLGPTTLVRMWILERLGAK